MQNTPNLKLVDPELPTVGLHVWHIQRELLIGEARF